MRKRSDMFRLQRARTHGRGRSRPVKWHKGILPLIVLGSVRPLVRVCGCPVVGLTLHVHGLRDVRITAVFRMPLPGTTVHRGIHAMPWAGHTLVEGSLVGACLTPCMSHPKPLPVRRDE